MITVGWKPFAARGMTVSQTAAWLVWAIAQYNAVCGCRMMARGGRVTISVRGGDFDWAAMFVDVRRGTVWVSKSRVMTGAGGKVFGSFLMHEFGHCRPFSFGHVPNETRFRTFLMHPWGSSHYWCHAREVQTLQTRFGSPTRDWVPLPIRDQASAVAAARRANPFDLVRERMATNEYWGRVNNWRSIQLRRMSVGPAPTRYANAVPQVSEMSPNGLVCGDYQFIDEEGDYIPVNYDDPLEFL